MLGKLLKYEWKATSRILLPLNLLILLFSILSKVSLIMKSNLNFLPFISDLLMTVYVFGIIVITCSTALFLIYRFYKALFTDEGYLTFTLPVKSSQILWSQLINCFIWAIINFIIDVVSIGILLMGTGFISEVQRFMPQAMEAVNRWAGAPLGIFILLLGVLFIVSLFNSMIVPFFSIAFGHSIGKRKLLNSFFVYLVVSIIQSIVTSVFSGILAFNSFRTYDTWTADTPAMLGDWFLSSVLLNIGLTLVLNVIFFILTNYFMKNKLNLE